MNRVVVIGFDPDSVDFSDPALPPGLTAEKIRAGVDAALAQMRDRGWEADHCFVQPDETAVPQIERHLSGKTYDCVVIGAGIRVPPPRLTLFEAILNAVHRAAPATPIAFNSRPEDSADAAARWIA